MKKPRGVAGLLLVSDGLERRSVNGSNEVDAVDSNVMQTFVIGQEEVNACRGSASQLDCVWRTDFPRLLAANLRKIASCGYIKSRDDCIGPDRIFVSIATIHVSLLHWAREHFANGQRGGDEFVSALIHFAEKGSYLC